MTQPKIKSQTLATYNSAAFELVEKFEKMGPNINLILPSFGFINKPNPSVLEVGFGGGKDANEILKKTRDYTGIDYSSEMFAITSRRFPGTSLIFADILEWETEKRFDIVFAFASFVHLDKQDAQEVFKKVHTWLNSDGIFTFSLKHGEYREEFIEDENGPRVFYRYNKELLIKLLGSDFKILFCNVISLKNNAWIDIICQKNG